MSFLIHHIDPPPPPGDPLVDALDRGLQLGDGVFDTALAIDGVPLDRDRHRDRLVKAAHAIGIAVDAGRIDAAVEPVLAELAGRDAILRTTLTRGVAARGLWPAGTIRPTLLVTAQPWSEALVGQPARLVVATTPRNERSPLSRLKTLAYLDPILAAREAAEAGADDALILNLAGRAACSTIANVFALKDGRLLTPPLAEGCLDGILRARLIEAAPGLGLAVEETPLPLDALLAAEAVFLTNSVRILRPVTAIGGAAIPSSPLVARILDALRPRRLRTDTP